MRNERFHKHVEGIIMGNPLGPTMANFFMAHLDEKLFEEKFNGLILLKFMMCTRFLIATKTATSFFRF